ncbi:hypothetical protein MSG28_001378 [Choristoneura fumiferana]|uniref:Uncharacterized protein n=1 Tax=Choristoneura fumiferana TaxID=7141 RepID=A0ACC0KUS6_CHOFU|nr:hypothetical protein MSG28_001378 [Choristoneura fumiferana]
MKPGKSVDVREEIVEVHSAARSPSPKHKTKSRSRSRSGSRKLSNGHIEPPEVIETPAEEQQTTEKSKRDSWIKSEHESLDIELPIHDQIKQGILGFVEKEIKKSDKNPSFAWSNCAYACHGVLGGVSLMHLLLISYSDSLDAGHLSFHAVVTMPYVATYFFLCVLCLISVLDRNPKRPTMPYKAATKIMVTFKTPGQPRKCFGFAISFSIGITTLMPSIAKMAVLEMKWDALADGPQPGRHNQHGRDETSLVLDRYYPRYHLAPPYGWMNDPNGFCFFNNEYHLFYQYNPNSSLAPGTAHWGHAKSTDLYHWEQLPIALYPDQWYDKNGVFSGSALVENATMYIFYTSNLNHPDETPAFEEHQILATSTDGVNVVRSENNPIINGSDRQPNFRDPKVWKHEDTYYMVLGNSFVSNDITLGRALLYSSADMTSWTEVAILGESNGTMGYMWECPDFFELDGKFVLLFSPQGVDAQGDSYKNLYQTGYIVGDFDYSTLKFTPTSEFKELDHGHDFYATQTILDPQGRRIVIGWFDMWDQNYPEGNDGFTGLMTIARELKLTSNGLLQQPLEETARARGRIQHTGRDAHGREYTLKDKAGEVNVLAEKSNDLKLYIESESAKVSITYDAANGQVILDRGGTDGVRRTEWKPEVTLKWQIFIDASSIELFCGEGEVTFSSRFFPDGPVRVRLAQSSRVSHISVNDMKRTQIGINKIRKMTTHILNSTQSVIQEYYDYYLWTLSLSDGRTKGWPLVDSPLPTVVYTALYLFIVWLGPKLMKNRQPFQLTWLLVPYNLAMAGLNAFIAVRLLTASFRLRYSYICEPCRQKYDSDELQIADAVWWYYFSKLLEFCDTFFFILRKKDEQLTFLHVYHHSTMFSFWWIGIKWIQFTCALVLGINGIRMGCEFPLWMHYVLIFYMISFIVLFGNFYMKAYLAKGSKCMEVRLTMTEMRPPARKGHPVMVEFSIYVVDVNSINVEDMDFRVDMFIRQTWSESRLQLPEDIFEEGDDHVTLPPEFFDNLWHPDPYFLNSKVTGTGPLDGRLYDVCIRSTRGVRGGKGAGQTVPMNKNKAQESMPRIIPVVRTSQEVCVDAKKPSMGFAETCGAAFDTVIFAMEGIGVVMPVENEMAKPQQFLGCPGVLNVAMTIVISLYGTVGFFGYIKYGDDVRGSVTLNLPQDEILAQTAKILMALAILFTYSLQFYVPMEMIWRQIHDKISVRYHEITQISIRTIAVVSSDAVENNIYNENSLDDADSELGGGITNDVENKKSNRDGVKCIDIGGVINNVVNNYCKKRAKVSIKMHINIYFAEYNINTISDCVGGTCIETVMMHPDKIIVHEDFGYKLDGLFNDIALMRLRESTPYTGDDVTKFVRGVEETLSGVSEEYGGPKWSVTAFCGLTLVVLVPLCQINKLKYLVPFSAIANFVWVGAIGISIYYCVRDPPKVTERNLATSITGIPNFISTSLFAMEGIGVVMPIENEMIKPAQFLGCPGVLNIAMVTVSLLYACVGFAGYLQYGDEVRGSLTLNLPQDEILAQSAKIMVACVMLLTFALIFYVPFDVVWRHLKHRVPARNHGWAVAGIRLVGTLLIVGIATAVPRLELFMELIGAILLSVMGLMLPAITETVFRWGKDLGPVYCVVFKNTIIVLFSLIAMVSGVVYSLKTMLEKL